MVVGDRALIVCVSADVAVRERLMRQLDPGGVVLLCADLDELREILFPAQGSVLPGGPPEGLLVDQVGFKATWRGRTLPLTRLELRMLGCLAERSQEVWTYQALFTAVWDGVYLGDSAILHSAMKRLRGKLRATADGLEVETVRGIGYRLAVRL
ncbi:MAG: winged helix-turn-helix transcriptional regulator [Hamadaea sp.]|nr:winged helix-turn-helix transcriptional regulator [Hamadaea sp.]NUR50523.1 winged helix-turn-helix transcriptional regulator [Hamadaea sp.]NUS65163.1 winged helix-turn-helix transcriptional regulator [Saccharothrix sp.]